MAKSLAFLCHPYHRGGVTSWMINAAYESARQGIKTYFITVVPKVPFISGAERPAMGSFFQDQELVHLVTTHVDYKFELGSSKFKASVYEKLIRENLPVGTPIIISDDEPVWLSASCCAVDFPIIGVLHSDDNHYYQLAKKYQNFIAKFVAVSNRIVKTLQHDGFTPQVEVIPCGIQISSEISDKKQSTKAQIVWVGRVEEMQKRVSDIPLIANELKSRNISFELHVLGHGSETDWLQNEIDKLELSDTIKLQGWIGASQIQEFYKKADFLLQTSNFEGMSVAVMEALAQGCSVISSRVSGVEDIEFDQMAQSCLRLYSTGDIKEAADKLQELLTIPIENRTESAIHLAKNLYSIQTCVDKYSQLTFLKVSKQHERIIWHQILLSIVLAKLRMLKYQVLNWKKPIRK